MRMWGNVRRLAVLAIVIGSSLSAVCAAEPERESEERT